MVFKMATGILYGPEDLLASILPIKVQISCEVTGDKKIELTYPLGRMMGYDFPWGFPSL